MKMCVRTLACGFSLAASLGACAAEWICETNSPVKADFDYAKEFYQQDPLAARGTSCFVKRVVNAKAVTSARWTVTGLGVFEAYVNGEPVDAANPDRPRLMPGFTDMRKTRHAFTFDVTGQMRTTAGAANVFAAEVTSGWWRDRIARFYGKRSAFRAELVLEYADGTRETVGTDTSWRAGTASPVQTAAIFDGEDYDARIARDWMKTGEGPGFGPAVISTEFKGTIFPMEGPHVRWREDLVLRPVSVRAWSGVEGEGADRFGRIAHVRTCDPSRAIRLAKGENLVVDFGQNCAAVPRFVFEAARGTTLRIQPREMLNDGDGLKSRGNDGPGGSVYLSNVRGARAEANYTFAGAGRERYAPAFTYFGYRYLALSATDEVVLHRLESVPVTSLAQAVEGGSIETGVPAVNRLVQNVLWGMRSNYLSVPTDCPQRNERLGWTADTQVFAPTATRFADVYGFLSKWMRDMRDTQMETGSYAAIAPFSEYDEDPDRFGWADAGIIVPHLLWRRTGDPTIVRDNWDSMTRMMARVSTTRHELMPGCFQFADWLSFEKFQPCGIPRAQRLNPAPDCRRYWNFLGACHWLRDARMMREMAQTLGKSAEAARYEQETARALSHIRATYLDAAGSLDPAFADLQGANVFALALGLFPDAAAKARGRDALVRNIRAHGDCLQTGFLSTPFLLQALTEAGAADVAYTLLLQRKFPSWLYSVDQGATTIWERWNSYTVKDGFGPVSMNSFNHYAYGCVAEWLFATAAGIQLDPQIPGYRHFTLAPVLDARLGHVTARQRVPVGEIASAWRIEADGSWTWTFTIPAGTTATVVRPGGSVRQDFPAGAHVLRGVLDAHALTSRVKWICPDEPFPKGVGKVRYYRRAFDVRDGLTNAVVRWWCDDRGTVFADGKKVPGGSQCIAPGCDLTERLQRPGRHVLAVQNENLSGVGGVSLMLALAYADGTEDHVYTSDDWRYALQTTNGWMEAGFDDRAWPRVRVHDDVLVAPWCSLADMSLLLLPEERAARTREVNVRKARLDATLARLDAERKPVCRIVYDRGQPWFDIGGRRFSTAFYNTSQNWGDDNRRLRRQVGYFRDAGMHLYGVGVDTTKIWRPDGSIDFERALAPMKSALVMDPEARFFYSINTVLPPRWWAERNPRELVGYANGTVSLSERECLRNCAAGSAASEVWRRDVCDYQRRLVEYLESTPYAKRIFAYRVDWGANHEWHYYGMRGYMPDAGSAMTAAFRTWLRAAYSNDVAALRAAWRDPEVTFETAETPSPALRLRKSAGTLRDPVRDRAVIDYERCHAATLRDLLLVSNRSVKEACGGRALVGNYGGYYFGMPETAEGWHLENDAVLDSPYVDFQCSPQVYGRDSRKPGGVQYARCLLEALRRRGKLSIQEADNSMTTFPTHYNHWSKDTAGDLALLARDFVQTLCWGCGYWYFDFGQGWYSDPAFADFFQKIYPIRNQPADCSSVAEVLVVGDYESVMFSHVDWPPPKSSLRITMQVNELGAAGAPFDSASFKDLASGTLRPYRVYLFPNFHYATPGKLAVVDRVRAAGGRIIWIGTPGTLSSAGCSPAGVASSSDRVFPNPATRGELRKLFREWGVHIYCDDDQAAVYACRSYVALHSATPGRKVLHLPSPAEVSQVYPSDMRMGTVRDIVFDVSGPATSLFRVDSLQKDAK